MKAVGKTHLHGCTQSTGVFSTLEQLSRKTNLLYKSTLYITLLQHYLLSPK